jgi:hypothetical protein
MIGLSNFSDQNSLTTAFSLGKDLAFGFAALEGTHTNLLVRVHVYVHIGRTGLSLEWRQAVNKETLEYKAKGRRATGRPRTRCTSQITET